MPNHVSNILIARQHVINSVHGGIRMEEEFEYVDNKRVSIGDTQWERFVDFNQILPMPSVLEGTVSPVSKEHVLLYFKQSTLDSLTADCEEFGVEVTEDLKQLLLRSSSVKIETGYIVNALDDPERVKEMALIGKKSFFGKIVTGYADWYDWTCSNWGTKWNAYSFDPKRNFRAGEYLGVYFQTAWATPSSVIVALSKKFPEEVITVMYADEDTGHNLGIYSVKNGENIFEWHPESGSSEANRFAILLQEGPFECGDPEIDTIVREQFLHLNENFEYDEDYEEKYEWVCAWRGIFSDEEWNKLGKLKEKEAA